MRWCRNFRRRPRAAILLTLLCLTFVRAQELASQETVIAGDAVPEVALADAPFTGCRFTGRAFAGLRVARGDHERRGSAVPGAAAASQMARLPRSIPKGGRNLRRETGAQIGASSALQTRNRTVLTRSERQIHRCSFGIHSIQSHSLEAGFNAGLDQASNRDPTFGQGAEGYERRFGADFAGQTTWRFFTDFAYPTIFSEDPRYYRLIHGSGRQRFLHAVEHTFVAQRDSGKHMFNVSQWLGTVTAVGAQRRLPSGKRTRGLLPPCG